MASPHAALFIFGRLAMFLLIAGSALQIAETYWNPEKNIGKKMYCPIRCQFDCRELQKKRKHNRDSRLTLCP